MANDALVTSRFKHVETEGGHTIITGYNGGKALRCEDEPIHIPGAVQAFGVLLALSEDELLIRIVSENSQEIIGYTPDQLFALENFTDILSKDHVDDFLEHLDFVRSDADVASSGAEVFCSSICTPTQTELKILCAMHINDRHPHLVICEIELEDDPKHLLAPRYDADTADPAGGAPGCDATDEDWLASTRSASKPLPLPRGKQSSNALALRVSKIIAHVQEQLGSQSTLQDLQDVLVGLIRDLTGFHRTMVYQFDQAWNGQVVAELLDPRTSRDLYKGLNFPATDIPQQARDLYMINKVRLLYDRDQQTARFVCRTKDDLASPLDLTYSYLRAMSPVHSQYLRNMAVRSSLSISINAFDKLWGLVTCHSYGSQGYRVSFLVRDICRVIGDAASRNIERISYISRLQMQTLINTVPTKQNPSGYITATSEDLLKLFQASFGFLTIRDETKMLGQVKGSETPEELIKILQYLRKKSLTKVTTSTKIEKDFPDLQYSPGFKLVAGLLLVPLSSKGQDFIVFFRKPQTEDIRWAGNPHSKQIEGHLTPRTSFKIWSETVTGSRRWTEEELEIAAVLSLVYGRFIEIWRQREAVLRSSQFTRVLLANSAHEVRTPLNAIINYLEIALEGDLDEETRDNLARSYSASQSLICVINDLLDLTATVEAGDHAQNEIFDHRKALHQVTDWFARDAQRKHISYDVNIHENSQMPRMVIGDVQHLRQAIGNIIANAIESTAAGGVKIDVATAFLHAKRVKIEICVSDTGEGMTPRTINALRSELAQLESEQDEALDDATATARKILADCADAGEERVLGIGLAVVAHIVHNMGGQLRLSSRKNGGSRFVLVFPFDLPEPVSDQQAAVCDVPVASADPGSEVSEGHQSGTATSTNPEEEIVLVASSTRSVFRTSNAGIKNEVDSLIEAIQKPSHIEKWSRPDTTAATNATFDQEHSTKDRDSIEPDTSSQGTSQTTRESQPSLLQPGTVNIKGHAQPLSASTIPNALNSLTFESSPDLTGADGEARGNVDNNDRPQLISSDAANAPQETKHDPSDRSQPLSPDKMRILVAEDNPVNSRILEKRLKKLGHDVYLTVNGEQCACAYRKEKGNFDIILMDIQVRSTPPHQSLQTHVQEC